MKDCLEGLKRAIERPKMMGVMSLMCPLHCYTRSTYTQLMFSDISVLRSRKISLPTVELSVRQASSGVGPEGRCLRAIRENLGVSKDWITSRGSDGDALRPLLLEVCRRSYR